MVIVKNLRPTDIAKFLNQNYRKKNGKKVELTDVQGYIRRKRTPKWLGDLQIVENEEIETIKLYHLIQPKNEI